MKKLNFSYNLKTYKLNIKVKLILILILIKIQFFILNKNHIIKDSSCNKWLVLTVFNPPNITNLQLLNNLHSWKIVIIANTKKNDNKWKTLNYKNLIYLSLRDQNKLNYNIIQYLHYNSYSRKNIGYLYAIEHGAKEIYEIDEDITFIKSRNLSIDFDFNNTLLCYGLRNDSNMINPYDYFTEKNIWPRGFRIKDIGNNENNIYYIINSNQLNIRPLIFQGLINGIPDVDSIFVQTRINKNNNLNLKYSEIYPLLYIPGNYIPINSKNTKYLYDIFPFLTLPTTVNEKICDIFRGYIIQRFAWIYNGAIIYHSYNIVNNVKNINNLNTNFKEEKSLFYNLDEFLNELNINFVSDKHPTELLLNLIKKLIEKGFLENKDYIIYKLYLQDLYSIGYIFPSKNKFNNNNIFKKNSLLNFYIPSNPKIILKDKKKIINHYITHKIYKDILLIINYNHNRLYKLNNFMIKLYQKYFPHIIFIIPDNINKNNVISCKESFYGYYSYICFKKIYENYPTFKGYLFINDDDYMKVWELDNLDFSIPWFYSFGLLKQKWFHYNECLLLHKILDSKIKYKTNLIKYLGFYHIPIAISDFYYIPNFMANKFITIIKEMYNNKIFLECAVPTTMAIINYNKYQIIYFRGLWGEQRKKVINYLKRQYEQITIHPIKFSNITYQKEIILYIYFINAEEY